MEERFMLRAVELAKKGVGKVNPNPLVGAVIVKEGNIIAEGYHARYGELHAERHAFSRLQSPEDARGAEMYVTLEPCCHQGKQPPCTQAIIEHGIRKVYVGSDDPNALVAGKGIAQLREAGIEVQTQVMKEACDALNPVFFHYIVEKTPYIVMKYAMTLDGKIACDSGRSRWVTGERAREHVQQTRNALTGIMVGIGTVLADDPSLTCHMPGGRNPVRIIVDSHLRIPVTSEIVQTAGEIPTIVASVDDGCSEGVSGDAADGTSDCAGGGEQDERCRKRRILKEKGVKIVTVPPDGISGRADLNALMRLLGGEGIDSILLEGGSTLNHSALCAGIVHSLQVYIAPKIFGGSGAFTPVRGAGAEDPSEAFFCCHRKITDFGEDILLEYQLKH